MLTEQDFVDAAQILGCSVPAIKAVAHVEAPRGGFNPDGSPVTLFEGHKFFKYTDGMFAVKAPDLCFKVPNRKLYGKTWQQEQERLQRAIQLDREAALKSASWGKFQVMGFNHHLVGFERLQDFVNAAFKSEREHLMMFVKYVQVTGLAGALKRQNWKGFALGYNGENYAAFHYDTKMASAYEQFS